MNGAGLVSAAGKTESTESSKNGGLQTPLESIFYIGVSLKPGGSEAARAVFGNRSAPVRTAAPILTPDYVGVHPGDRSIDLGSYPRCATQVTRKS
jgi:hypothetical protein